ncbi:MAG: UDP-glucose 4-epimerase GalE [Candidatus Krumholzibacteriia bacterium]
MKVCVSGGAGYIGSVVAQALVDRDCDVTVIDNFTTGHRSAIPRDCRVVEGDVRDERALRKALGAGTGAVLHFAALSVVADSVREPLKYFDNNVGGTLHLLDVMRKYGIHRFVFSSSAAVYGEPDTLPIEENAPCLPTSPYGQSKLFVEKILQASRASWDLQFVSLRYFNAGGSTKVHGEHHEPESHLIPIVLDVASGRREQLTIYGDDYETKDGTCTRDYIHVADLASAHVLALDAMERGFSGILNLGSDEAFSVLEVAETVERITGKPVARATGPRRPGDPAALLASSRRAEETLKWKKTSSSLDDIVRSAWEWRLEHPDGYPD